ncbi:MAG: ORF6N domain-containing protein [Phycisphaerales bacterium]
MSSGQRRGNRSIIPTERIQSSILLLRGEKVLLDTDLAALYAVETKVLLQAVRRNSERFPDDFMFQLTPEESDLLRSQSVTLEKPRDARGKHRKYLPYAFTEQGVAMLSSVLRSPRAVSVNIEIMRAFVSLRRILTSSEDLARRLDELESRYDGQFRSIFEAIRALMEPEEEEEEPRTPIGFRVAPVTSKRTNAVRTVRKTSRSR